MLFKNDIFITVFILLLGMGISATLHSIFMEHELKEFYHEAV